MRLYKFFSIAILFIMLGGFPACRPISTDVPTAAQPSEPPTISAPIPTAVPTPSVTPTPTPTPSVTPAPIAKPFPDGAPPLTEADFIVEYNNFKITPKTTFEELVDALGYGSMDNYEREHYNIPDLKVFSLYYPEFRVVFKRNPEDNSPYISFIDLHNGSVRGLKVGESNQKAIDIYGQPDKIVPNAWEWLCGYKYYFGEMYLEIILANDEVYDIKICYNPKQPKQQGDPFNGLETFPVKFYNIDVNDYSETVKKIEEISSTNFVEDTIKFFNLHYGTQIDNIWYEGNRICVDLNRVENLGFNIGSTGSYIRTSELIKTLSDFPNVEEIEVLISGERGCGADHFSFNGIFKVKEGKWNWQ